MTRAKWAGENSDAADEAWRASSACRPIGGVTVTHLFYAPDRYEPPAERRERLVDAEALCRSCGVRGECKAWVLSFQADPVGDGYCAGMSREHRDARRGEMALDRAAPGATQLMLLTDAIYGDGELSARVFGPRRQLTA